jgi:glycosyltransferase involved in cell wall biosynthesis
VEVDETLAELNLTSIGRFRNILAALSSPLFAWEVATHFVRLASPAAARRLLVFAAQASRVASWFPEFVRRHQLEDSPTILYTYWLDYISGGLLVARKLRRGTIVVSRAHGFDLYEHRHHPAYLPCHATLVNQLDRIYLISEHGRAYLRDRQPEAADCLAVSRLGTRDPGFLSTPSADGVFRVASCSALVKVKRVDLLVEGLAMAARSRSTRKIDWIHFGDGPLRTDIEAMVARIAPKNFRWHFAGQVPNSDVFRSYQERPTDLFANTSESEGLPVSIMEAQSCGIPSMAPAVGGVPEIVSADNGFLLNAPASPRRICDALTTMLDSPEALCEKRHRSRADWQKRFDSGRNFSAFAKQLRALVAERLVGGS